MRVYLPFSVVVFVMGPVVGRAADKAPAVSTPANAEAKPEDKASPAPPQAQPSDKPSDLPSAQPSSAEAAAPTAVKEAAAPASQGAQLVSDSKTAMGTRVSITVYSADVDGAHAAIAAAFAEIDRLEAVLSEWRQDSEVSRINQAAGGAPVKISPDTMAILRRGKEINKLTGGAFALTWAVLRPLWHFEPGAKPSLPDPGKAKAKAALIDDTRLSLDEAASTATLPADMAVGIGAITEGYALQRAMAVLKEHGFGDALVYIGGDILVAGQKGNRPWLVGIQDPRGAGYFATIPVQDEAVTTSGDYEKFFEVDGVRYSHIIDPRTGMPAQGTHAVTVVGKDAMTADALATSLMVLGVQEGLKLVESTPNIDALFVDAKGEVTLSSGLKNRVRILRPPSN